MTKTILIALSFLVLLSGILTAIHLNFTIGILIAVVGALDLILVIEIFDDKQLQRINKNKTTNGG